VWSAKHGHLLTSLNLQFVLSDLLVSADCSRMMARMEKIAAVPIISLTYKHSKETTNRALSVCSMKSFDDIKVADMFHPVLPVKPKPLLYTKQSNMIKMNSVEFTTSGLQMKTRRYSEANGKGEIQVKFFLSRINYETNYSYFIDNHFPGQERGHVDVAEWLAGRVQQGATQDQKIRRLQLDH
jgi:hypothetical protein